MKRDMELARTLLAHIESGDEFNGKDWFMLTPEELHLEDHTASEIDYHLMLLVEAGLIHGRIDSEGGGPAVIARLTWQGHEFLDDTRDPEIWATVRARAAALGGIGVALFWDLVKSELKQKLGLH